MALLPRPAQPKNRSEVLALVLKQMADESKRPNPRTWGETGVRALTMGLQGHMASKAVLGEEEKKRKQAEMLADILASDDPSTREQLMGLHEAGFDLSGSDVTKALMERLGFGKKDPKAPNVETFFDDEGREHKRQWNAATGEWEQVGGSKASSNKADPTSYREWQRAVESGYSGSYPQFLGDKEFGDFTSGGESEPSVAQSVETPGPTVPEGIDYSGAMGTEGFVSGLANTASELFGQGLQAPENERAMQALDNLQVRTRTALQSAVPGRPSQYLLEQLGKLAVEPGSLSMGPERAKERLRQTRDLLREEISRIDLDVLGRPRDYTRSQLAAARGNRSQLAALLRDYEVVVGSFQQQAPAGGGAVPKWRIVE